MAMEFWHGGEDKCFFAPRSEKRMASRTVISAWWRTAAWGQNKTGQRTVLYLGEINDSQEVIWRRTLQVFDESQQQYRTF
jgi:hypothetical protein